MKIAFVVSRFPTLSESFVVRQIIDLLEAGHDVRIVSFNTPVQEEVQKEVREYGLCDKTRYIVLPASKWGLRVKGLQYVACGLLRNPKAMVRLLLSFRSAGEFCYSDVFLTSLFLREPFDVVHAHFGPNGAASLCIKKAGLPVRHITTFHGYDVSVYAHQHGPSIYQELFELGDVFTYNSEATKQKLLGLGCPDVKMRKLPMGIDCEKIPFKERMLEPGQTVRLLSVGRLVEMKGREYAIRAAAILAKRYPIHYDIVGDGPLREELQTLIDELGLNTCVYLRGWVSSEQLEQLYKEAHLFIHPSVTSSDGNEEGQGVVLLEAQAHGIPVVATRHGAFPDSVMDGQTGFLVAEKDTEGLAGKIESLINSSERWPGIGKAGRRFAETSFDARQLNKILISLYQA